ncbi:sorting nexin-19-like [Megalops cyprinoides]|uniref:sorting nexin-19-like n=1 Tax=Megalops cyprinoides TaxID=118141 RepID=UPI001863C5E1|nr:sorting nexin-19-like [Megalops cyprinoides]
MSHPETPLPSPWALPELLGQRRLLGFGALLAWMVLFHLLVNVWLLCVFTSLLVVLGGWLGSQAVLDANSVVHLEHFISLKTVPHSPESELQLDREIQSTIHKIVRDFVSSWYRSVSSEEEFEAEVQGAMLSMAEELKSRARRVDRKALTQRVLDLCGCHLQSYMRVREVTAKLAKRPGGDGGLTDDSLWKLYCKFCRPHPALKSSAMELNYARAIVDLLLHVLVPPPHLESRTGRFVVGELITCNVLLPLVTKMSDPDWLNLLIIDIFTKSSKQAAEERENPTASPPPLISVQQQQQQDIEVSCPVTLRIQPDTPLMSEGPFPELPAFDVLDPAELYYQQEIDEEARQEAVANLLPAGKSGGSTLDYLRPDTFNLFYQESDSDIESPLSDYKKCSMESLVLMSSEEGLTDRLGECVTSTDISVTYPEEEPQGFIGLGGGFCPKVLITEELDQPDNPPNVDRAKGERKASFGNMYQDTVAEKEVLGLKQAGRCDPNELSFEGPLHAAASGAPLDTFSFEPLSSPDGPVIIQNLRITGTITAKEHKGSGSHPYTLYTVKYETTMETETPGTFQPVAYHTVNRRYSEFLNLQTRLEEKPELRKVIKNVKGPKKPFPDLPFGNTDIDKVGARKGQLEAFLKQLCAIPETANSEEVQEFLALNTDARIAFVKKPFVVSRIDKIVVNAIVDTLKTAFPRSEPQSPTEDMESEPDGKTQSDGKKPKSRLRFSSKIAPALNVDELQPKVLYCFSEGSTVFSGLSLTELEGFLKEQEKVLSKAPGAESQEEHRGSSREATRAPDCHGCLEKKRQGAETALADVALNILCLLMKDQWGWLCTENVQKTIRLLFGTFIDRWLDVGMANLTSTPCWVIYLRVLQEAVWPDGTLPVQPRPARSDQQKEETRQQSLQCLMKLLPDLIPDMLGSEKYKLSWQTVLESLQDPHINRHVVYSVCDLLLECLIPESSDEGFQRSLLHSLSGTTEKASV